MPDALSYHSLPRWPQINGKKSMLMLSREPVGKLIVFVHGFGGNPLKTWLNYHTYLTLNPKFKGCDLLFYHYDSKRTRAVVSGELLDLLMTAFTTNPNYFESYFVRDEEQIYSRRHADFSYERIYFVAHSFGALVTRRAMLASHDYKHEWHKKSKMILFAPAHLGAIALDPIKKMLWPFPILLGYKLLKTPTLNDVDRSSPYCKIAELLITTHRLQSTELGDFTISEEVVWARDDEIVDNNHFLEDKRPPHIVALEHGEVCKPNRSYMLPVELLEELIKKI